MLLHLDCSQEIPIYQQIRNEIVLGIASGKLAPGTQMPSIRALAETLGVNMMTVSKAYTQLKQEGYLLADRRAGTVVAPCRTGVMHQSARAALEMAVSEARAAGVPLETVLDLCRRAYGET